MCEQLIKGEIDLFFDTQTNPKYPLLTNVYTYNIANDESIFNNFKYNLNYNPKFTYYGTDLTPIPTPIPTLQTNSNVTISNSNIAPIITISNLLSTFNNPTVVSYWMKDFSGNYNGNKYRMYSRYDMAINEFTYSNNSITLNFRNMSFFKNPAYYPNKNTGTSIHQLAHHYNCLPPSKNVLMCKILLIYTQNNQNNLI